MKFDLQHSDQVSKARAGVITTDHGVIETPIFMPVGTAGSVKAVHQWELEQTVQAQIILGNTYHLYLRPGLEVMKAAGGLHMFNGWKHPILTDSGGYQVFSLSGTRKITKKGVTFKSHIDGSSHMFSPEVVMDIQRVIGADIIMAFDECPPYPCDYAYAHQSLKITSDWLARCFQQFRSTEPLYGYNQSLFPIVQGSVFKDLRMQSVEDVVRYDADGYAIGGLSVGEPAELMYEVTDYTAEKLPADKPRYLMGVGTPGNILEAISLGIDMFDCVMPTRNGRNGMLFTTQGIINIRNEKWKFDQGQIDAGLDIPLNQYYSKSYLRHLFISGELLGLQIASLQNLSFYLWLVKQAREQILAGNFVSWKKEHLPVFMQRL